jgi:hypothetical protein
MSVVPSRIALIPFPEPLPSTEIDISGLIVLKDSSAFIVIGSNVVDPFITTLPFSAALPLIIAAATAAIAKNDIILFLKDIFSFPPGNFVTAYKPVMSNPHHV